VTGAAAGALLVRYGRPLVPVIQLGSLTLVVLSGRQRLAPAPEAIVTAA
jgi:hypothetical protein